MPIFEFICNDCEQPFEELIFGKDTNDVVCPACGGEQVRKKMSTFASKMAGDGTSLSLSGNSAASCDIGGA